MKRLLLLLCTALLVALFMCSCMQQAGKDVKEAYETVSSEVKENMDNMVDNGTVRDGDGYIGEDKHDPTAATRPTTVYNSTDDNNLRNNGANVTESENDFI